jgi:RecA/RadA recombinase
MPRKKKEKTPESFNLLESDSFSGQVKETMLSLAGKRKAATSVQSMSELRRNYIEFDSVYFQSVFGMCGFPTGTLLEILGQDGVGKSSFIFTIAGQAMAKGSPFFYVETEGKPMDEARVKRCLSTDPTLAEKMYERITMQTCDNIPSMVSALEDFVDVCRNQIGVPKSTPLFCAVDSYSKLMSPTEAIGRSFYEGEAAKKNEFGTDKVNFGHAKFAHQWCRILPTWLNQNNVFLVIVSHQNQQVSTGFGGGSFMSPDVAASYNRTKIGGNAFNQNAALQVILTRKGLAKNGMDKVGTLIKCMVAKNSYGPEGGVFEFEIISRPYLDTDTYTQPSVYLANTACAWLAANKHCGVIESRKRYSCEELGLIGLKAEDFYPKFCESHLRDELCSSLGVIGYDVKDTAVEELSKVEKISEDEVKQAPVVSDAEEIDS